MNIVIYSLYVLIAYPYVIYPCLSFLISRLAVTEKRTLFYPDLAIVIAAYNEIDWLQQKLDNTFSLNYPPHLLNVIVVTDGSTDGTDRMVALDGRAKLFP